jgi:hypothetical protein
VQKPEQGTHQRARGKEASAQQQREQAQRSGGPIDGVDSALAPSPLASPKVYPLEASGGSAMAQVGTCILTMAFFACAIQEMDLIFDMSLPMQPAIGAGPVVPPAASQLTKVLAGLRHTFVVADATLPDMPLIYASEGWVAAGRAACATW